MKQTETIYLSDLNANDEFMLPQSDTLYVCESRRTQDHLTSVVYRIPGTNIRSAFTRVNLTTVYRVV